MALPLNSGWTLIVAAVPAVAAALYVYWHHSAVLVGFTFIIGAVLACIIRRWRAAGLSIEAANDLTYRASTKDTSQAMVETEDSKPACLTCGKNNCQRHKAVADVMSQQPWWEVIIPERVDRAIESFFGMVLRKFVYQWYRSISDDEAFVIEVRKAIRFAVAVLIKRLRKVDVPSLLEKKVIPEIVKHAVITAHYRRRDTLSLTPEELGRKCFKDDMHYALTSTGHASEYVRAVVDGVLPHILSSETLQCPALPSLIKEILTEGVLLPLVDKISDSDTINRLLLVLLDKEPPPENTLPLSPNVVVLERFMSLRFDPAAVTVGKELSSMGHSLASIIKDQLLLVKFMDFMRCNGAINYMQLFLSVDNFRKEFVKFPIQHESICNLHKDMSDLYHCFLRLDAQDRVNVDIHIVDSFKQVVDAEPAKLFTLCSVGLVNSIYEYSRHLLEDLFLPDFLASSQHFSYWYGLKQQQGTERGISWKPGGGGMPHKRMSRVKDFLSVAGEKPFREQDLMPTVVSQAPGPVEEESTADQSLTGELHDLESWHVEIPCISIQPNEDLFRVQVQRRQGVPSISVYRNLDAFIKLDQKLKEFHGSAASDLQLPTKGVFKKLKKEGTPQELDLVKPHLEEYLKRLLGRAELKNSELLHSFLVDEVFLDRIMSDNQVENVLKSVSLKVAMERGQHLAPFLQRFLSSTKAKVSSPKTSGTPLSAAAASSSANSLMCITVKASKSQASLQQPTLSALASDYWPPTREECQTFSYSIFGYITYIADEIFQIPKTVHTILMTVGELSETILDRLLSWFVAHKVALISQEHRIEGLFCLLQDAIFSPDEPSSPASREEARLRRRHQALSELQSFVPGVLWNFIDKEYVCDKIAEVFWTLQQPVLNRQLAFVLLDVVLQELFEELGMK